MSDDPLVILVVLVLSAVVYFAPAITAQARGARHAAAIWTLNLLLGWTFVGWAAAAVWAMADDRA